MTKFHLSSAISEKLAQPRKKVLAREITIVYVSYAVRMKAAE
jgi:hypothetical protein